MKECWQECVIELEKALNLALNTSTFLLNSHDCFSTACYAKHHRVLPGLTLDFLIVICEVMEKVQRLHCKLVT